MVKCDKCNAEMNLVTLLTISAPSSLWGNLTKRNLRRKGVEIMGVLWEGTDFICPNCNNTVFGYRNYVQRLEEENQKLKQLLAENTVLRSSHAKLP